MPAATSQGSANNGTAASAAAANNTTSTSTPSTPVKVPSAAASYTPATLDPDLRSQINMVLIRDGHVTRIQDYLLHILHADTANWPAAVQAHALQLLRSGEYNNFPALMDRVMDDIRQDTTAKIKGAKGDKESKAKGAAEKGVTNGTAARSLALPQSVIEEALRATRESLDMVCEIEE